MMDIMIDLETLATTKRASILSIGAVAFHRKVQRGNTWNSLHLFPMHDPRREVDLETVEWWSRQSPEAQELLNVPRTQTLDECLVLLTSFIDSVKLVNIWANPPEFDLAILEDAYESCGMNVPWKWWQKKDSRTVKELIGEDRLPDREGTPHDAVDDCIYQARVVQKGFLLCGY